MIDFNSVEYYRDCRYFRGDVPCRPHKMTGVHCPECREYDKKTSIVLIIKLGAIGDVIRTTPLISRIRSVYPDSEIWWLTYSPDILPPSVDKILPFTLESILQIRATGFKVLINLDKDPHACALAKQVESDLKIGYILNSDGKPDFVDHNARNKFLTGIFDDVNKANRKSYLEEIFEICGWEFKGEEYVLEINNNTKIDIPANGKKIIGLNTGCGDRWKSRLWNTDNWISLIKLLTDKDFFPVLLGGAQENEKNLKLGQATGAYYPGFYPLKEFISLVNNCDLVVTAVTMALHIAIGLKKKVVLMNNIFNPYEFELYGRGEIVQPAKECQCFFSPNCTNNDYFCMDSLTPEMIMSAIIKNL